MNFLPTRALYLTLMDGYFRHQLNHLKQLHFSKYPKPKRWHFLMAVRQFPLVNIFQLLEALLVSVLLQSFVASHLRNTQEMVHPNNAAD